MSGWQQVSRVAGFVLDGVGERRCINMACDLASQSLLVSFLPIVLVVKSERGYGGKFNVEIIHQSGDQSGAPESPILCAGIGADCAFSLNERQ